MRNNEIMISVEFDFPQGKIYGDFSAKKDTLSFIVPDDITLRDFLEGLYYGLYKNPSFRSHFIFYKKYIKEKDYLVVNFSRKQFGEEDPFIINCVDIFDDDTKTTLTELGFVTSSILIISETKPSNLQTLFDVVEGSYILDSQENKLEYNISSRNLEAVKSTDIEILPPGEAPAKDERTIFDAIIPTALSIGSMLALRYIMMNGKNASDSMQNTMLMMTAATGVMTLVTTLYTTLKQGKLNAEKSKEWKRNYEHYIEKIIGRIAQWQQKDIDYLENLYPNTDIIFQNLKKLDCNIFSRSQNDNDFMRINLGISDYVKPLFNIKHEEKDYIFNNTYFYVIYRGINEKESDYGEIIDSRKVPSTKLSEDEKVIYGIFIRIQKGKGFRETRKDKAFFKGMKDKNRIEEKAYLLSELPARFSKDYFHYLKGKRIQKSDLEKKIPYTLDIRNTGALGFISESEEFSFGFVQHTVLNLAYYHSSEDLQFVFFFRQGLDAEERERQIRNYKFLPHCNELLEDMSQFVFDKKSAGEVFGQLLSIMNQRVKENENEKGEKNKTSNLQQIVCVIFDDYDIKSSAFSKFLPEAPHEGEEYKNNLGLTFLFMCDNKEKLPRYCGNVINAKDEVKKGYGKVIPRYKEWVHSEEEKPEDFRNSYIFNAERYQEEYELAYRRLSAIYYTRIAENGKVPNMVTLFELYGYKEKDIETSSKETVPKDTNPLCTTKMANDILGSWKKVRPEYAKDYDEEYDVTKNLRVPIGANEHGNISLDLYEKADGPHMLVAGTTGSGKSETIITYLIGLCMKFSPLDLNLMLVDMKGGGFSDRLGNLPHCVGVVTDTAGESEGISAAYMLKRFLETLNAEIKRRKLLLQEFGIDTADAYIQARRIMEDIFSDLEHSGKSLDEFIKLNEKLHNYELSEEEYAKFPNSEKEIIEKIGKLNEKQIKCIRENKIDDIKRLSHLVLVVDEFTELKRFSSENDGVDFISEITTIARVGRTLGFHIILVSQNIEGAITDDIRVNSKARICLKVATKQASKDMIDSPAAADPKMPLNGRAYLLVGTGTRFEYFQSAYTGENQNLNIEKPVNITYVPDSGKFDDKFYRSKKDNQQLAEKQKNIDPNAKQLNFVVNTIIALKDEKAMPDMIFCKPLRNCIKLDTSKKEWRF